MQKNRKKMFTVLVATTLMGSLTVACSSSNTPSTDASPKATAGGTTAPAAAAPASYPLKTDKTLTYWGELPGNVTGVKAAHADIPFFQEWQKKTGVPLKFLAPPTNQASQALNVLLASGDLPDMIEFDWQGAFPGGPEKAIKDGYILKLNDTIDKFAPNLKKYLKEHPEIDKQVKTDNGSYYSFPFIRGDDYLRVYQGPIIRKDWLDELGLPIPETIDDWYTTLKAFKEKKGATAAFSVVSVPRPFNELGNGAFAGAYGVTRDFYIDNGTIKFGPAEKGYKDFLATMHKWYEEGLIDKNFATADGKALDANMASGATGVTVNNAGGGIGKWQPLITAKDPKGVLVAAPYPVLKKGDIAMYGQKDPSFSPGGMVAITASSKNIETAAKLLDYGYSEEGHNYFNFGTEGVSYKMENGYPKYTDLLMKNPDKLAPAQALSLYVRGNYNGPFVQDKRYIEQYLALQTQRDAVTTWQKTDVDKHKLPPVTATPEESTELAKIMTDVNTLVDEMTLKIILGTEPVDSFDKYQEKFKSVKLSRALEIKKASLDRFNKR
ncbi:extracellular solute-binding protein [Paenibacillus sp. CGMCC 1.16610]|uniref:Extracellular solute-binding protein n=3 Tax=Paenibacillus TaxID=44249 RepID=A0ABU3RJ41_9BACL|nr:MULTISPECIES: extracellular solute-binding protein [Paenibacillus]MBA2944003.1 extracellular solute-binding protein [Paenibacillus sp. CGMCC 1.16610]MCY9663008.1 extracellular solute-binding protein [Paenibacillus anseongense]MDU0204295.1 extracellular solute-binding protein [Paenibacillus sp. PFR10]MEB4795873.1 extracellular solute-binding protein [Paenibacillus chondroitinus]MEC0266410.1 extracellular solute-binding protein [Paenibacillus anseongense]